MDCRSWRAVLWFADGSSDSSRADHQNTTNFWGDIVSDDDACQLHERLQVHPLYSVVLQCLNKRQQSRMTAFDTREQIQSHVSFV